jgi:hypothetical protein
MSETEQSPNPLNRERLAALGGRIEASGDANALFSSLIDSGTFDADTAREALRSGIQDQEIRDRYVAVLDSYSAQRQTADKVWEFATARRNQKDSVDGALAKMFCEWVTGDYSGEGRKWGKVTVSRTDVTDISIVKISRILNICASTINKCLQFPFLDTWKV